MPTNVSEMNLEDMILAYLRDKQGYEEGTSNDYVKDYALDTERVKQFLLSTQRQKVENTACFGNEISEWSASDNNGTEEPLYRADGGECREAIPDGPGNLD